jgi:3-hydroxyisobutyrate dehydrogenase-like beta-hydroxyacid dehydrogenase
VTQLGIVGLGHMGGNMAARFLAAGYAVYEHRDLASLFEVLARLTEPR